MKKSITNFTGGLNKFLPPKYLQANECAELRNIDVRQGELRSVQAHKLANSSVSGYYCANFAADSGINYWFTHNNPMIYVDWLEMVYKSAPNELSGIEKYTIDGTSGGSVGLDNPTSPPSLYESDAHTSPFFEGDVFQYVYTFATSSCESAPSPVSQQKLTADGKSILIQFPSPASVGASVVRIYRAGGGAGDFMYVGETTGTSFTDHKTGAELGYACDTWGNEKPPNGLILDAYYRGFFVGHVDHSSELRFSNPTTIESWNPLHMIRFDSKIMRAIPYGGALLVFCESGVYQLIGDGIENFEKIEIPTEQYCVSADSILVYNNQLFYQSSDGICTFDGANSVVLTKPKMPRSWFAGRKLSAGAKDGQLFFGDENGILCVDTNFGMLMSEFDSVSDFSTFYYNPYDDQLYMATRSSGLYLFAGDNDTEAESLYISGNIGNAVDEDPQLHLRTKYFRQVGLVGSGVFDIDLIVDGETVVTYSDKALSPKKPLFLFFPRASRGLCGQVRLEGKGSVTNIDIEFFDEGEDYNG